MDTQLIQNDIMKFETSQFQLNNQKPANSISIFASGSMRKDKAGRSLLGRQYVWALVNWLAEILWPDNRSGSANKNDLIKIWLISSITKTLRDQTGLTELFSGFNQNT